jgi:hypothetical protein
LVRGTEAWDETLENYGKICDGNDRTFPTASNQEEIKMATYECDKCGMSVNATCGHCDAPLENDSLELPDGKEVQISKCPNGHGKIKSPLCCGQDMTCSI